MPIQLLLSFKDSGIDFHWHLLSFFLSLFEKIYFPFWGLGIFHTIFTLHCITTDYMTYFFSGVYKVAINQKHWDVHHAETNITLYTAKWQYTVVINPWVILKVLFTRIENLAGGRNVYSFSDAWSSAETTLFAIAVLCKQPILCQIR